MKDRCANVWKLFFYQSKLFCMKTLSIMPILFIMFIILGSLWFLGTKSKMLKPTVLVCNEDDSFIGRALISGILKGGMDEVISFRETNFEEGRNEVNSGLSECMLHIKKDSVKTLYRGENVSLDFFVRDGNNDFTKFVIAYVKGFIEIINTSQNAGLFYMDVLYENGMTDEMREALFQELQLTYSAKALSRGDIFEIEGNAKKWIDSGLLYFGFEIFICIFSVAIFLKNKLWKEEMRERLRLSGYLQSEVIASILCFIGMIDIFIIIMVMWLFRLLRIG